MRTAILGPVRFENKIKNAFHAIRGLFLIEFAISELHFFLLSFRTFSHEVWSILYNIIVAQPTHSIYIICFSILICFSSLSRLCSLRDSNQSMENESLFNERQSIRDSARQLKKYGSTCNHVRNNDVFIRHNLDQSDTLQGIALKYGCTVRISISSFILYSSFTYMVCCHCRHRQYCCCWCCWYCHTTHTDTYTLYHLRTTFLRLTHTCQ